MNTKHLSLFVKVMRTENITQVARELYVSQPAISMQLKRLEQEVGVPLFTIIGRNISMTDAGLAFLEYAESTLALEEQIFRVMEEFRLGSRGRIVVGASSVVGTYLLPKPMLSFTQTYPDIKVDLETKTDDEIERLVRMGSIDVGITLKAPEDHFSFRITRFSHDKLIGIQPSFPLDSRTILIPGDMFIPLSDDFDFDIIRLDSTEAVKRFVMEGMGYGVVLESAANLEIVYGKLQYWSEYTPQQVVANVMTRPAERLSKSVWYFLHHLRK